MRTAFRIAKGNATGNNNIKNNNNINNNLKEKMKKKKLEPEPWIWMYQMDGTPFVCSFSNFRRCLIRQKVKYCVLILGEKFEPNRVVFSDTYPSITVFVNRFFF